MSDRAKSTRCSSSLCFLGCTTFEEVEFRRFDICGAQCGLLILFLVTDIHTQTAKTDGSCLGVVENPGLVESRAFSPVLEDISAVTFIGRLLTEEILQGLIRNLCYVGLFSQIQRQRDMRYIQRGRYRGTRYVQSLCLSQLSGTCSFSV